MILTLSKSACRVFITQLNSSGITAEGTLSANDFFDWYHADPRL